MHKYLFTSLNDVRKILKKMLLEKDEPKLKDFVLSKKEALAFLGLTLPTSQAWTNRRIIRAHNIQGRVYHKKNN